MEYGQADLGPLQFPTPKAYEFLDMIIYVHEGEFVLLTEINVDDDFEADKLEFEEAFHFDL